MSNWPQGINYGHSNWTGAPTRTSKMREPGWLKHDGRGGYASNSGGIPAKAIIWAAVAVALFFAAAHIGAAAGM